MSRLDINALVRLLNEVGEQQQLEAKRGTEAGESVLETVCALSNEPDLGGGDILLGIEEEDGTLFPIYRVAGVRNADKISNELSSKVASVFNKPVRVSIHHERIGNHTVLRIHVPEATPSDKPLFFLKKGLPKGAYRRIGATDVQCTEDDLHVFFSGRERETYDCSIAPDASLDDIDPAAISDYRKLRSEVKPDAEELLWTDEELLRSIHCIRRSDGDLKPTIAGIVLFGKTSAIRRVFPMLRVDYARVSGREWVADVNNRFDTIDMRGPAISVIRRAVSAVTDDIPTSFQLVDGAIQRQEKPLIPSKAIREAIVNSVMHRNYRVHQPVQIIRYANRLEVTNPGYSLKPDDLFDEPGSQHRNPVIAAVLHETGLAETKGSGIRVMRKMIKEAGLSPPTFDSDRGNDRFKAIFLFHHMLDRSDIAWLASFKEYELTDEEAKALIYVREVGRISNAEYRDINSVETLNASKHLRKLRAANILVSRGKGAGTYYEQGPVFIDCVAAAALSDSAESLIDTAASLIDRGADLVNNEASLRDSAQSSRSEAPQSAPEAPRAVDTLRSSMPLELKVMLEKIKKRMAPDEVRSFIVALCEWREVTADQITGLLRRDRSYVSANYLKPLLESGRIAHVYHDSPSHPRQAYRSAQSAPE